MKMTLETADRLKQQSAIDLRLGRSMTASTETCLASAVLTGGFARKITYSIGLLYGLFVWSVAEGFGGPYGTRTSTDVGAAIVYSLLFGTLLVVDAGRTGVDAWIEKRWPAWRRVAELRRP
jgi:nitrite reductase (NO-forming)